VLFPSVLPTQIGKTIFIIHALFRRLEDKQPTVVQLVNSSFIFFDDMGAWNYPDDDNYPEQLPDGTWALVDSGVMLTRPANTLLRQDAVIIQTTPPVKRRWKGWKKEFSALLYIMDVWSYDEIGALLCARKHFDDRFSSLMNYRTRIRDQTHDVDLGLRMARTYGPCIRNILDFVRRKNDEVGYRRALAGHARRLVHNMERLFPTLQELDFSEDYASSLIFVRPDLPNRNIPRLVVPTRELVCVIAQAAAAAANQVQHAFFAEMMRHPSTRASAAWMFENLMHTHLTMDDGSVSGVDASEQACAIPATTSLVSGTLDDLTDARAPFYWRPARINIPGVDAILCRDGEVWLFQATMSRRRRDSIFEGLDAVTKRLPLENMAVKLVFVGPVLASAQQVRIVEAARLSQHREWKRVVMYACEWALGKRPTNMPEHLNTLMSEVMASKCLKQDCACSWHQSEHDLEVETDFR
jgi:hypothetical protein